MRRGAVVERDGLYFSPAAVDAAGRHAARLLARHYGVSYIISGHIHQMLHFELDGVTYISMASSGGHLREPKTYTTGWFFQHTLVTVHGSKADFAIKELAPPFGQSRVTSLDDWGALGLKLGAEAKSSR